MYESDGSSSLEPKRKRSFLTLPTSEKSIGNFSSRFNQVLKTKKFIRGKHLFACFSLQDYSHVYFFSNFN